MKRFSFITLLMIAMFVVGCSNNTTEDANDDQAEVNTDNDNEVEEGSDQDQAKMNEGTLKLGETGLVINGAGDYEVTSNSVEIFKERDGEEVSYDDEVFVLIDYTIKNIGEDPFPESDILGAALRLENKEGNIVEELTYHEYGFVAEIDGELEPGETYESQLLFIIPASSEYILRHQSIGAAIDDAEWVFTEDEAK